ncbi:MAG: GNAT family N-acetyltransferase [Opitutales bacterium]|nr:GNAT family N-acetyltransferase [Opitutales bacterium]
MKSIHYHEVSGPEVARYFSDLARLRITVFREFPYLYEGAMEYEERYLETYFQHPESYCVLAFSEDRIVGASTGVPFVAEGPEHTRVFAGQGIDPENVFYFGESVLEKDYRGQGIGKAFFQYRESHARRLGRFTMVSFCAVERPPDHPRRPPGYQTLHPFWEKVGFVQDPRLRTTFTWKDLDEGKESPKTMIFWRKDLLPEAQAPTGKKTAPKSKNFQKPS